MAQVAADATPKYLAAADPFEQADELLLNDGGNGNMQMMHADMLMNDDDNLLLLDDEDDELEAAFEGGSCGVGGIWIVQLLHDGAVWVCAEHEGGGCGWWAIGCCGGRDRG